MLPDRAPTTPAADAPSSWWQMQAPSPGWDALTSDARCDVLVVGGGVTGCSTARTLARAGASVILLEAREIASGASGRNGGFLLAGLAHRFEALTAIVGVERAAVLHQLTVDGRERLLATAAAVGASAFAVRTGSLRLAVDQDELGELEREASLLEAAGFAVERLERDALPRRLRARFLGGLRFPDDGRSQPAGWVRALAADAAASGAALHERTPVIEIEDEGDDGVRARTADGHVVQARRVVVCTEAWLPGLLGELHGLVLPYRSQVLATEAPTDPTSGDTLRVLDHVTWSRRGWDYAQQTAGGELVVGGELLEQVERLRTWDEVPEATDQAWLERWIEEALDVRPAVLARWGGVLAQTPDGFPYVGALPQRPGVFICGGWGGAGNVLGFVCGELVARLAMDDPGVDVPVEFDPARISARP